MTQKELTKILESHRRWIYSAGKEGARADLTGADLTGANLRKVNLYGAILYKANLRDADLRGANLAVANLRKADLAGADLRGADLCEAYLRKADLYGAINILSLGPIGSRGDFLYAVNHGDKIMIKTGCFWGYLEEFAKKVQEKHGDNPHGKAYASAIAHIKVFAAAYWGYNNKDK
jgi:hypothetical protein